MKKNKKTAEFSRLPRTFFEARAFGFIDDGSENYEGESFPEPNTRIVKGEAEMTASDIAIRATGELVVPFVATYRYGRPRRPREPKKGKS